jgi:serine/threonine-protein kinase
LLLIVAEDREDTATPPGQILAQRPLPGSKLHVGESVNVVTARAPAVVKVPGVVGQLVGEARVRLEKARLTVSNVVEQPHPTLGVGMVIAQSLAEGTEVRAGTGVELKVSKGAEAITVPAVTGKSLTKAKDLLAQAGLTVGQVRHASDDDRSPGVVLEQKPAANQTLGKGMAVDLVVNSD